MAQRFLVPLCILYTCVAAVCAWAEPGPRAQRTQALLSRMNEQRTAEEATAYRREIVAWADTLVSVGEPGEAARCLERAGIVAYLATDYDEALAIWERGLGLARESGDPERIGALLNARASGVSAKGDNVLACELFAELVTYRRAHGDERGAGVALSNLAFGRVALFQYPEAIADLREAIAVHRAVGNRHGLAHSRITLSELLAHAGRVDEAAAVADSAVADARATGSPLRLAPALHVRALRRVDLGDHAGALADFDESLALARDAGLAGLLGPTRINRADLLVTMGGVAEAVAEARAALADVDLAIDPAQAVTARGTLGRALWRAGDVTAARDVLVAGADLFFARQDSLAADVQRSDANVVATPLSVLALLELDAGDAEAAWRIVESGLARQLRLRVTGSTDIVPLAAFQARLAALDARALVVGIAGSAGCPVLLVTPEGISGGSLELTGGLARDMALVADLVADDLVAAPLARVSAAWNAALPELAVSGRERLVVMPGGLDGFPFELLDPGASGPLGETFSVSYAPSASVLAALEDRSRPAEGFLALADPAPSSAEAAAGDVLALRARESRSRLPSARAEVRAVAPAGGLVLVDVAAGPAALLAQGPGRAVVHVATHASVDRQHPAHSALLLAPDPVRPLGVLTAGEIADADFVTDLVVLSGCSTVGGYRTMGEGTFGLARSFLQAGARTVVASRWDVTDRAARRCMELFYAGLARGLARDRALAAAGRQMRDEGFGPRDHAAFALVGAVSGDLHLWQAGGRIPRGPLLLVGAVAVAAVAVILRRRRST